jgi:hypothetical protein
VDVVILGVAGNLNGGERMNPYSGDIERFSAVSAIPSGWLQLTEAEAKEFARLPNDVRLEHYIKSHHGDKCGGCGCFIGNHSLRKFKDCAANELARFDTERIERQARELFAGLPARDTLSDLKEQMRELEKVMANP